MKDGGDICKHGLCYLISYLFLSSYCEYLEHAAWSVGQLLMALIAYYERRWRYLQAWVVLPDIISFLIFLLWVPQACSLVCRTAPHGSDSLLWETMEISASMGRATWYHIFSYLLIVSNILPRACSVVCATAAHGSDSLQWETVEISTSMGRPTWYHIFSYFPTVSNITIIWPLIWKPMTMKQLYQQLLWSLLWTPGDGLKT